LLTWLGVAIVIIGVVSLVKPRELATVEANPNFGPVQPQQPQPLERPKVELPQRVGPNLAFVGTDTVRLQEGLHGGFYKSDDERDTLAAIACFRNEPSSSKKVKTVFGARAFVVYRDEDGKEIGNGIPETCWIGEPKGINFNAGDSHCVILVAVTAFMDIHGLSIRHLSYGRTVDIYPLNEKLKTIELQLLHENDPLLERITFDFSMVKGSPVIKRRE
jgi:hypothetical protein